MSINERVDRVTSHKTNFSILDLALDSNVILVIICCDQNDISNHCAKMNTLHNIKELMHRWCTVNLKPV